MDLVIGFVIGSIVTKTVETLQTGGDTKNTQSVRKSKVCPYYIKHLGRKCKNRVAFGYYCYVHNKYRKGLRIKKSEIQHPDAGKGLFAEKKYKINQIVAQYQGKRMTKKQIDEKYDGQADFTVCNGSKPSSVCVDAAITSSSNGRYANTNIKNSNNTKLTYKKKKFRLIATKPIDKNDEIYANYGYEYTL